MGAFVLAIVFTLFPPRTQLPYTFQLSGATFTAASVSAPMPIVLDQSGERALRLDDAGMTVTLPISVDELLLRVGTFALPIDISTFDSLGKLIGTQRVAATNGFQNLQLGGKGIKAFRITGGGNEVYLSSVTITVPVAAIG